MNSATIHTSRVSKRATLSDLPHAAACEQPGSPLADLVAHAALTDDGLCRRWERISLGDRA